MLGLTLPKWRPRRRRSCQRCNSPRLQNILLLIIGQTLEYSMMIAQIFVLQKKRCKVMPPAWVNLVKCDKSQCTTTLTLFKASSTIWKAKVGLKLMQAHSKQSFARLKQRSRWVSVSQARSARRSFINQRFYATFYVWLFGPSQQTQQHPSIGGLKQNWACLRKNLTLL